MRPYRGKRIDNGEEVRGYYIVVDERHFIVEEGCYSSTYGKFEAAVAYDNLLEVDLATVSQSTGLKDKKRTKEYPDGQPIWEGNISVRRYNEHYPELKGIIKWDECEAKFVWYAKFPNGGGANCTLGHYLNGHSSSHKEGESKQDEVIGNKWDTPELLEQK